MKALFAVVTVGLAVGVGGANAQTTPEQCRIVANVLQSAVVSLRATTDAMETSDWNKLASNFSEEERDVLAELAQSQLDILPDLKELASQTEDAAYHMAQCARG